MTYRLDHGHDGVALLALDRPPVNALDLAGVLALEAAFKALQGAPPTALVLTGAGRAFCAGADTRAFAAATHAERAQLILAITRMIGALYALPCPAIAGVNGHALGGGFVLVLACDVRLAVPAPDLRMGLTEARAGVPFPAGPLEIIKTELGPNLLRRLTLTSAVMSPGELHEAGVVDALVDADQLIPEARRIALDMASQPGFGLVKAQLRAATIARLQSLAASGEDPLIAALGAG